MCNFGRSGPGCWIFLLGMKRSGTFGPSPGREPLWSSNLQFWSARARYWISHWAWTEIELLGQILAGEPFWSSNLQFWTARTRLLNFSSGNELKRSFWSKSWPGALLQLKCAISRGEKGAPTIQQRMWEQRGPQFLKAKMTKHAFKKGGPNF